MNATTEDSIRHQSVGDTIGRGAWALTLVLGVAIGLLGALAAILPSFNDTAGGTVIGWLLLAAGIAVLSAGLVRRTTATGKAGIGAGSVTAAAGILFILLPQSSVFPVSYVVMVWLLLRGTIMLLGSWHADLRFRPWLFASGAADLGLVVIILSGLPVATLVSALFGPTKEVVASFALIFAASFLVTGLSLIAMANACRQDIRAA